MDKPNINRRLFLGQTGLLVLAGSASARAVPQPQAGSKPNPFGYDLSKAVVTDPKLLLYEETARFACPTPEPRRLTVAADGHLYIAAGEQVTVLDPSGQWVRSIPLGKPVGCVALDGEGAIYVGARDRVEVFDRAGNHSRTLEVAGPRSWFTALALAEDAVFIADAGDRAVLRVDKAGKLLGRIGVKNTERSIPGLVVPSPYLDLELAPDGLLRVNNPGRHRVELYTAAGDLEQAWGSAGGGVAGFSGCCNPIALALLPGGGYVTCEKGLPRVKVYGPTGHFEGLVAGTESFPENMRAGSARRASDGLMGGLDAAVDAQGRVYVLDLVANNVRVMTRKG